MGLVVLLHGFRGLGFRVCMRCLNFLVLQYPTFKLLGSHDSVTIRKLNRLFPWLIGEARLKDVILFVGLRPRPKPKPASLNPKPSTRHQTLNTPTSTLLNPINPYRFP